MTSYEGVISYQFNKEIVMWTFTAIVVVVLIVQLTLGGILMLIKD